MNSTENIFVGLDSEQWDDSGWIIDCESGYHN